MKSIHFSKNQFIIKDVPVMKIRSDELFPSDQLSGAYLEGVQYYDLKNVQFINNTGMADLIDLLKSLLQKGIEVQFVNANEMIKNKIRSMGLEHILNCK
ncbi:MAG: STAS domain-containing protein [Bacteroidota bacterium]